MKRAKKNSVNFTLDPKYGNITVQAFDSMFRFFYYGVQHFDILHACQLFQFAKDMNLYKLSQTIEQVLSRKEFSEFSIIPLLDVAFNPLLNSNQDLQRQLQEDGLRYAVKHSDKIDFTLLQYLSPCVGMNILLLLQQTLRNNWGTISHTVDSISLHDLPIKSSSYNHTAIRTQSSNSEFSQEDLSERSENKKRTLYRNNKKKQTI